MKVFIKRNFNTIKSSELFINTKTRSRKWHSILKSMAIKYINVFKIVSFVLSIPETSSCERVLSVITSKWRGERNRCSDESIKNELLIYINIKGNYLEFAKNIKDDANFQNAATSQGKYTYKDLNPLFR